MLSPELRKMIEARFGQEITESKQCVALAQHIYEVTHQSFGDTSAKRMFGLTSDPVKRHQASTMDIIAQYLGYADRKELAHALGNTDDISMFEPIDEVDFDNLAAGEQIQLTYNPDRLLTLTYMGDFWFIINESKNSKLQKGDRLRITQLAKGFDLLIADVVRNGRSLGNYHAAKDGGITTIELFNGEII